MRRFFPEICGVECGSREKSGRKRDFFASQIFGEGLQKFFGAFANRHHFQSTCQVWLRSHCWSFVYADEIKKKLPVYGKYSEKVQIPVKAFLSPTLATPATHYFAAR